jgi:hypothetical protein
MTVAVILVKMPELVLATVMLRKPSVPKEDEVSEQSGTLSTLQGTS